MTYSIEDLRDPGAAIAAISERIAGLERAGPLLAALDASDPAEQIAATVADLERSFAMLDDPKYLEPGAHRRPFSLLKIYFAGSEVEPWYPQIYWLDAWVEHQLVDGVQGGELEYGPTCNAESVGGGDLFAVAPLAEVIDEIDRDDPDLGDELRRLFVLSAWRDVAAAIEPALASEAFARLAIARPFRVVATPGHDEPRRVLAHLPR